MSVDTLNIMNKICGVDIREILKFKFVVRASAVFNSIRLLNTGSDSEILLEGIKFPTTKRPSAVITRREATYREALRIQDRV